VTWIFRGEGNGYPKFFGERIWIHDIHRLFRGARRFAGQDGFGHLSRQASLHQVFLLFLNARYRFPRQTNDELRGFSFFMNRKPQLVGLAGEYGNRRDGTRRGENEIMLGRPRHFQDLEVSVLIDQERQKRLFPFFEES
jgi:hypothetical protein